MITKIIERIERILLNETVDRCARATKFAVGGGTLVYGAWYGLDEIKCGAPSTACFMFAGLATMVGLTAFAMLGAVDDETDAG